MGVHSNRRGVATPSSTTSTAHPRGPHARARESLRRRPCRRRRRPHLGMPSAGPRARRAARRRDHAASVSSAASRGSWSTARCAPRRRARPRLGARSGRAQPPRRRVPASQHCEAVVPSAPAADHEYTAAGIGGGVRVIACSETLKGSASTAAASPTPVGDDVQLARMGATSRVAKRTGAPAATPTWSPGPIAALEEPLALRGVPARARAASVEPRGRAAEPRVEHDALARRDPECGAGVDDVGDDLVAEHEGQHRERRHRVVEVAAREVPEQQPRVGAAHPGQPRGEDDVVSCAGEGSSGSTTRDGLGREALERARGRRRCAPRRPRSPAVAVEERPIRARRGSSTGGLAVQCGDHAVAEPLEVGRLHFDDRLEFRDVVLHARRRRCRHDRVGDELGCEPLAVVARRVLARLVPDLGVDRAREHEAHLDAAACELDRSGLGEAAERRTWTRCTRPRRRCRAARRGSRRTRSCRDGARASRGAPRASWRRGEVVQLQDLARLVHRERLAAGAAWACRRSRRGVEAPLASCTPRYEAAGGRSSRRSHTTLPRSRGRARDTPRRPRQSVRSRRATATRSSRARSAQRGRAPMPEDAPVTTATGGVASLTAPPRSAAPCGTNWGERGDLNPRPPGPQPGALTF